MPKKSFDLGTGGNTSDLGREASISRRDMIKIAGLGLTVLAGNHLSGCAIHPREAQPVLSEAEGPKTEAPEAYVPRPNKAQYVLRIAHREWSPDGSRPSSAITANGVLPAPEIRVKEGEYLRVQVENRLNDQDTSIHWHGLLVPAGMDGVPNISHVPLPPGQIFIYEYPIRQSGTYWYHSHYGFQEQMGLGGPFIIEPKNETRSYDRDYVLFLSDWLRSDPGQIIPNLRKKGVREGGGMKMPRGPDLADVRYDALLLNGKFKTVPWTGIARPGDRIRLRLINGAGSTFFRFMIEGLELQITHADGLAVRPFTVDNLLIGTGECYDMLVTIPASGSYLIRAQGLGQEGEEAIAVLHTPDARPKVAATKPRWGPRQLSYRQILAPEPTTLPEGPVKEFHLNLTGNMDKYIWSINNQVYPQAEPLHIKQGEQVRLKIFNTTEMWHPMHLHGHFFRLEEPGVEKRFAPLKHTVGVAPKQTVRLEFTADNPGNWFFHCHNLYHLEAGMAREFIYKTSGHCQAGD